MSNIMHVNTNWWNRTRYTLYAPFYDLIVRRIGRGRRRALELLDVQPGERVLIVGCGTGLDLEFLPVRGSVSGGDRPEAQRLKGSKAHSDDAALL